MAEDVDDYVLRWPRDSFKKEAARLLNERSRLTGWSERCELLLEDAFVNATPRDDFVAARGGSQPAQDPWSRASGTAALDSGQQFMVALLRRADGLREVGMRTPYYSQRRLGSSPTELTLRTAGQVLGRGV